MKNKTRRVKIIVGGALFLAAVVFDFENTYIRLASYLIPYLIIGGDVLWKAVRNILHGKLFDENFLMCIATVGAFSVSYYSEGVAVMLFYQVGEYFQDYAVNKSRKSIASLMDIRPDYANVKRGEEIVTTSPDEVQIGETVVIKAGEKIPLDAVVLEGFSMIDTSALTGESVPRDVEAGSEILSGCINLNGLLTARVTKEYGESTVSKILDLVENASSKKSNSENFITKFAKVYTPSVVIVAALLAAVPPLIIGAAFSTWLYRALIFLVISCPCALVLSIPLGFFGGIGGASRCGILIKGSNYLEALASTEIVVFDKTGTLTKGVFNVAEIHPDGVSEEELLTAASYAECYSNHPISLSLQKAHGNDIDKSRIGQVEEIPGHGVKAVVDGRTVLAGNKKLMLSRNILFADSEAVGTLVHVAIDGKYAGYIIISDQVKDDAKQAIAELKKAGVKKTVMLTGDAKPVGEKVGADLGLDLVYAELLPGDKVEKVEELFADKSKKGRLAFVGDGINDAPVLARADIGIAMGGLGSDAAIEAADVVIMTDEPSKLATAMKISKRTLSIVKQNIIFALSVKAVVLVLGAIGLSTMWEAVFADVGVAILAILNAMRVMNVKKLIR